MAAESGSRPRTMTLREAVERDASRRWFSSGSASLDRILGGGFRTSEMVEVFGASATGKTQLAIQTTVSAADAGFTCAYVDTEGKFRPERLASICENRGVDPARILPRVYCIRAESTQQQFAAITRVGQNRNLQGCRMVIVDTVTKNFTLEYPGSRMMANRQTALGAYLNRLALDAFWNDRAVILVNRVASIGTYGGSREVDIGGETLRHFVQKAVGLERRGDEITASRADRSTSKTVRLRITDRGIE